MNKGLILDIEYHVDEFKFLLKHIVKEMKIGLAIYDALPSTIVELVVKSILEENLDSRFSSGTNYTQLIHGTVEEFIDAAIPGDLLALLLKQVNDSVFQLRNRIFDIFHSVDTEFAYFNLKKINDHFLVIEYAGDWRIAEWYELREKTTRLHTSTIEYDFSINSMYNFINSFLVKHMGKYATKERRVMTSRLVSIFINDYFFKEEFATYQDRVSDTVEDRLDGFRRISKEELFLEGEEVNKFINDVTDIVESTLTNLIKATITSVDDVVKWSIDRKVLYVQIKRVHRAVDLMEKLRQELKRSVENGDYVPRKELEAAGIY